MTEHKHNLRHWDKHADIDPRFTKAITGRDYSGTSPNPQYVIKCLTEIFGPVGQGFGWSVLAEGVERFGDTSIHWCRIQFWHTSRENTFESYGQTKFAYMTRGNNAYMKVDEDAPKKSLTDAIIKAASHVGIAANIFLGRWDDQKYVAQVAREHIEKEKEDAPAKPAPVTRTPSGQPAPADMAIAKLNAAQTLDQLAKAWTDIGKAMQNVPEVFGTKENRKAELDADAAMAQSTAARLGDDIPEHLK